MSLRVHWLLAWFLVFTNISQASDYPIYIAQARPDKENAMNCYISERRVNRDNTRLNCIYKCPNGKTESEVVPKGVSCPPYVNVAK